MLKQVQHDEPDIDRILLIVIPNLFRDVTNLKIKKAAGFNSDDLL